MRRNSDHSPQQSSHSIMVPDLRLCTIRLSNDHDRRFVFEIISPHRLIIVLCYLSTIDCFSSRV